MSKSLDIIQPTHSLDVDVSAGDQELSKKPCLIKNNQGTGAFITILLQGDTTERITYFGAGEILPVKVVKVFKTGTTSGSIVAYYY